MKRYAIKNGVSIGTTSVKSFGKDFRNQEVLTIFNSKRQALNWRDTWKNWKDLKLCRVEISEIVK